MYLCKAFYKDKNGELLSVLITNNRKQENYDADSAIVFMDTPIAKAIIEADNKGAKEFTCNGFNYTLEKVLSNKTFEKYTGKKLSIGKSRIVDFTKEKTIQKIYIYKSKYKCTRCQIYGSKMSIESVTAKLYTISGRIILVDMAYCKNCRQYFIDESTLGYYEEKNGLLAVEKIIRNDKEIAYREDSVLSRYGYKADGTMSEKERRRCLSFIIENGLARKYEIIDHLNYLIKDRGFRFPNALQRWKSDLEFVHHYDIMKQKFIGEIFVIGKECFLVEEK